MRVLLDSNILARAAHNPHGPAGQLLAHLQSPDHVFVLLSLILDETDRDIDEFTESAPRAPSVVATPANPPAWVAADPDDNVVIATAIAGRAGVLCTLDRHLRQNQVAELLRQSGIDVVTDVELLDRLRKSANP